MSRKMNYDKFRYNGVQSKVRHYHDGHIHVERTLPPEVIKESLTVVKPLQEELSSYADAICQRIQNGTAEVDLATEKQRNYMTVLGIEYDDKTSKREAQKLISEFLKKKATV